MKIDRNSIDEIASNLKQQGFKYLVKITAVDYVKYIELIYIFRNLDKNMDNILEIELEPTDLWVNTIMNHYKAADWYERELQEMFGIKIKGRDAERLLLEKWDGKGHPLRKNFEWGKPYET